MKTHRYFRGQDGTFVNQVVARNRKQGEFVELSVVADNDKTDSRNFNYAFQSKRSPGSTIKPLLFIRQQLKPGWALNKQLITIPMQYDSYKVDNYAGIKRVEKFMYQALAESLNLPAANC